MLSEATLTRFCARRSVIRHLQKKSVSLESSENRRSQTLGHLYISGEFNFEFLSQRKGNLAHRIKTGILTMLNPRNR
jgi:hypothetical protein